MSLIYIRETLFMNLLTLKNVSRKYLLGKNSYFYALKNVNLHFLDVGLVSIVGSSGSGKTTLLNLIGRIDEPSEGEIIFSEESYRKKKKPNFYKKDLGIIFQNFNLLDDRSALFNVEIQLLISGYKKKAAIRKAKEILEYVNIKKELFNVTASKLSGGEKQRVAIARAIAKEPRILLCDEPTGSLDSSNSIVVMELLKKISKSRLVIMVSHNLQLVDKYSDRIIEISDGKIVNDYSKSKVEANKNKSKETKIKNINWGFNFSISNFTKRIKRNIFVILSLSISICMANIVIGFINGKDNAIKNACYQQLDYGSGSISKEEMVGGTGVLKLTKSVRPDLNELNKNQKITKIFEICPNFSSLLPQNPNISYDDLLLDNYSYLPIYSYQKDYYDPSLISRGHIPNTDTLYEVIINKICYQSLMAILHKDPLFENINISHKVDVNYVDFDGTYITDTFNFELTTKIVGVVDELSYLASNKIYYSQLALETYMQEYVLLNLSTYFDNKITWYDRVMNAENYSYLSSYSYLLFLKDYRYREDLDVNKIFDKKLSFTSSSIIISNSLMSFLDVARYALILFLAISVIGSVLILSIISYTNYSEDRKVSAILSSLGARNDDIEDIYLNESLISGFISLVLSLSLSYPLASLANRFIEKQIFIKSVIQIPYKSFLGIPFLYPLALLMVLILISVFATIIPIKFSKRNTLKMELNAND